MEIPFESSLQNTNERLLLDVRSPGEFAEGHIPGAISFPLFTDEERAEVGTIYKRQSADEAVHRGLEIVGPKMAGFVEEVRSRRSEVGSHTPVLLYCWRGGMRSSSMEWLFNTAGIETNRIRGGYKAYRQWVHESIFVFAKRAKLEVLGGNTGSGKTEILAELRKLGEQVLDLEGIANHRGSAFGHLLLEDQPSNEHFANLLAFEMNALDLNKRIWIEDESRLIGRVVLPNEIFDAIQAAPHHILKMDSKRRAEWLVELYGDAPIPQFEAAFDAIKKRLGGNNHKEAIEQLASGNHTAAAEIALNYYDKAYNRALEKAMEIGETFYEYPIESETFEEIAKMLVKK